MKGQPSNARYGCASRDLNRSAKNIMKTIRKSVAMLMLIGWLPVSALELPTCPSSYDSQCIDLFERGTELFIDSKGGICTQRVSSTGSTLLLDPISPMSATQLLAAVSAAVVFNVDRNLRVGTLMHIIDLAVASGAKAGFIPLATKDSSTWFVINLASPEQSQNVVTAELEGTSSARVGKRIITLSRLEKISRRLGHDGAIVFRPNENMSVQELVNALTPFWNIAPMKIHLLSRHLGLDTGAETPAGHLSSKPKYGEIELKHLSLQRHDDHANGVHCWHVDIWEDGVVRGMIKGEKLVWLPADLIYSGATNLLALVRHCCLKTTRGCACT